MPADNSRLEAAVVVVLLFLLGVTLFLLAFVKIPSDNMPLFASMVSGVIGSGIGTYIGYRYGSSKSSAAKDETISKLTTGGQ